MFIPTTAQELRALNWAQPDIILVSGDTYLDSPYNGIALIGQRLLQAGYHVGIIAQPALDSAEDITRLGEPALFWGVSAGMVDSMVANTTALGKPRRFDDNTPGGLNNRRPNRATIAYTNLIRRFAKPGVPIVLGGIEASLRRLTHYDFWSDALRRPILLDAKADYLLYGMADNSILALASALKSGADPVNLRGLCYLSHTRPTDALVLPSFEAVREDKAEFTRMFRLFYQNNDPISAHTLAQQVGERFVIQNPPSLPLSTAEMDAVYGMDFMNDVHPFYAAQGEVRALETIRHSIPTHRGCYGECSFCAIAVHEGRRVTWRSQGAIMAEARRMASQPGWNGIISDLSGPTANMYGFECRRKLEQGACPEKSCLYPSICPSLSLSHRAHLELLQALRKVEGVRKVFVASGIRHDMVMADTRWGEAYLQELTREHVSGQLKLAPEHSQGQILARMRKSGNESLLSFKHRFDEISAQAGKRQFLTYYFIAAFPGCEEGDMLALRKFAAEQLQTNPEQVQIFTPTPSTWASLMYYTETDPYSGEPLFVEKGLTGKMRQKALLTGWRRDYRAGHPDAERVQMTDQENFEEKGQGQPGHPEGQHERPEHQQQHPAQRAEHPERPWRERSERPERTDGFRPRYAGSDRPIRPEEAGETRVVRDDNGGFFMNRRPAGWVDRKERQQREHGGYGREGERSYREGGERPYRPRTEGGERPYRPRTEGGERPYRPRPEGGERPYRPRTEGGERPYRPRTEGGERPYRPRTEGGERPHHEGGERPYRPRTEGSERPYRPRTEGGERPHHEGGERPYRPRTEGGERPHHEGGERPYRPRPEGGERPYRPRTEGGERPYRPRTEGGERPYRPRTEGGERPYRPRTEGGERPYRPRPEGGERPYRPRTEGGERPYRPHPEGGERPHREGGERPYRPRTEGGERPYRPRTEGGERPYRPRPEGGERPHREGGERPYRPRTEGGERPYRPRTEGSERPHHEGGERPHRGAKNPKRTE